MWNEKNISNIYRQGSVWYTNLPVYKLGAHIEKGSRPYIVVSCSVANNSCYNITVVPCTTKLTKKNIPAHAFVEINGKTNVVMCEQVVTIGKEYLGQFTGFITGKELGNVLKALKNHFGMEEEVNEVLYSGYPCCKCVYNDVSTKDEPCCSCGKDFVNFEEREVEIDEDNNSSRDWS